MARYDARDATRDATVFVALLSTALLAVLALPDAATHGVTGAGGAEGDGGVIFTHGLGVAHERGGCLEDGQEGESHQEQTSTRDSHHVDLGTSETLERSTADTTNPTDRKSVV